MGSATPAKIGGQDDQAFAQVGGKRPGDELGQVVEHPATFLDGSLDGGEVVVGQDHVRRFFGHLGAGDAHRHSDVRLPQGGSVVDPIARHGHDVAPALQRVHQAQLLLGSDAGEHGGLFGRVDEVGVADGGQLRTVERCSCHPWSTAGWAEVQLMGDSGCSEGVVPGDHLHLDAGSMAGFDGFLGLRPRGVDHALQPQEDETRLHVLVSDLISVRRQVLTGEGEHP